VQWNGPVLELHARAVGRLGPDILDPDPDLARMVAGLRRGDQGRAVGDALLDQRLVAGIGNIWRAEALWEARVSPWRPLADVSDAELRSTLAVAHRLMSASVEGGRPPRRVYRRTGRACPRCGTAIRSRPQGEPARTAYWCPGCQRGAGDPR
jgi:endonuclease VIII